MELHFYHPEFEAEVRTQLGTFHRPVTEEDVMSATHLDLSNFDFLCEDMPTLSLFKNLKSLEINIRHTTPEFWHTFSHMEKLYVCLGDDFDFISFANMKKLSYLFVSGGDYSSIDFVNLDALIPLKKLCELQLHEFGSVDILPLASMPQLRDFGILYANKVHNIDVIGTLSQLETLTLTGLYVDNLDFLDRLPDYIRLEMCGNHVYSGVDPQKWKRFSERDICEISVSDKPYEHIDLSILAT